MAKWRLLWLCGVIMGTVLIIADYCIEDIPAEDLILPEFAAIVLIFAGLIMRRKTVEYHKDIRDMT